MDRTVYITIKAKDGTTRTVDAIGESLKRLQKELSKPLTGEDKTASYKAASYNAALKDIDRMRQQNARNEKVIAAEIMRTDTLLANNKTKEAKRAANESIREINRISQASQKDATAANGIFSKVLGGSFFGGLGSRAVSAFTSALSSLPGFVADLFNKSANFSQASISLAQFEGSVASAQNKIAELIKVSAETPGLSFLSAVEGQKRLEAVGFQGDRATKILQGLSKVRVLSGASKEDFDAMIVNFVQIASGGQKVTQEIREMATRMPFLVGIIKKEFGGIGKELNDIDPKEFIARLSDAAAKTEAAFNSSSLATENFQDSIDRLYISIGSVIEQNPTVIGLFQLWTNEIDGVTNSFNEQDSAQQKTFSNFVSWLASGAVRLQNFGNLTKAVVTDVVMGLGLVASRMSLTVEYSINKVAASADYIFETIAEKINQITSGINQIAPALSFGGINIPYIPQIEYVKDAEQKFYQNNEDFKRMWDAQDKYFETQKGWFSRSDKALTDNASRYAEFQALTDQAKYEIDKNKNTKFKSQGAVGDSDSTGDGKKTSGRLSAAGLNGFATDRQMAQYQAALRKLSPALRAQIIDYGEKYGIPSSLALAQIFSESTFNTKAKSPFNANVGQSAYGLTQVLPSTASGLLHRQVSGTELFNSETALTAWGKYMTKLFDEFGDWELAAFAYHNGEGAARQFAKALDSGNQKRISSFAKGNPKGVAYAKKIAALSGLSKDEQFAVYDPAKESDKLTKEEAREDREKRLRAGLIAYRQTGLNPNKQLIGEFQQLLADDVRKGLSASVREILGLTEKELKDKIQPSAELIEFAFQRNNLKKSYARTGTVEPPPVSTAQPETVYARQTPDEEYVKNLRISLGLQSQQTDETDRYNDLVMRRRNMLAEISATVESDLLAQDEEQLDLAVKLGILEKENADKKFVATRRALALSREEYELKQSITDIEDKIANQGANNALRYRQAWLQAIYDVRDADTQAVESQIQSQVKLADAATFHVEQVRANVLSHLAEQKTLTQTIGDEINSLTTRSPKNLMISSTNQSAKSRLSAVLPKISPATH